MTPTTFAHRGASLEATVVASQQRLERVLAIDPSSTCIGYAVMDGAKSLIKFGRLTPHRAKDDAIAKIRHMARLARDVALDSGVAVVVVENASGKVHGRVKGRSPSGQAVYGMAVGYVLCLLDMVAKAGKFSIVLVDPNDWTRRKGKDERQRAVALEYPDYQRWLAERKPTPRRTKDGTEKARKSPFHPSDPGGDVSDAIALGRWWHVEAELENWTKPGVQP